MGNCKSRLSAADLGLALGFALAGSIAGNARADSWGPGPGPSGSVSPSFGILCTGSTKSFTASSTDLDQSLNTGGLTNDLMSGAYSISFDPAARIVGTPTTSGVGTTKSSVTFTLTANGAPSNTTWYGSAGLMDGGYLFWDALYGLGAFTFQIGYCT